MSNVESPNAAPDAAFVINDEIDREIPRDEWDRILHIFKRVSAAEARRYLTFAREKARKAVADKAAAEQRLAELRQYQAATQMDQSAIRERFAKAMDISDLDPATQARIGAITDPILKAVAIGEARARHTDE